MNAGWATMGKADRMMSEGEAIMKRMEELVQAMGTDLEDLVKEIGDGIDLELVWGKFEKREDGSTVLPLKVRIKINE